VTEYPEHDKLSAIKDKSQAIYEFLSWVDEKHGVMLADDGHGQMYPVYYGVDNATVKEWLAEFFEIDLDKIEAEKNFMIDQLNTPYEELCGEPVTKWRLCNGYAGHPGEHGNPWSEPFNQQIETPMNSDDDTPWNY
jgi:hypothetical protein